MPDEIEHGCLKGLPLHDHPEWLEPCADVLNEEWPRSKTARLHMLEKSNTSLPYCMVLLKQGSSDQWELIGHSRLCVVHGQPKACFVESVVIGRSKRGQGFGRKLMEITEQHALRLGYTTLYLTTHDKQLFYEHVGYSYCKPVISLGSASKLLSSVMFDRLFGKSSDETSLSVTVQKPISGGVVISEMLMQNDPGTINRAISDPVAHECTLPTHTVTVVPPLPPPPPPPLPSPCRPREPSQLSRSSCHLPKLEPVRMNPNKVFWMTKFLK
ncbi:hypothetical protein LSH36_670g00041 [Paralvinella palmiformis]|uniref:N-acetyltransferase domain-containing protein n=1 Tax=Paralvinella palmiformis TaxID=53620 RepID=A0AAD9MVF2_9ANNE|nr:hypothetical protein LSH36_670g00041 [Paralvinella palmiformis]